MPVSKEQLAAIIGGHARELCSAQNDKKMDAYAGRGGINEGYFDDPDPNSFIDNGDADRFDAMLGFGVSDSQPQGLQYNQRSAARSRMPENIKQSMLNEQIDVSRLGNTSVLDGMNITPKKVTRTMNEQVAPQGNAQMQYQGNAGFDANYLKFIIKECLNEYFSQQPLNESVSGIKTIGLGKGYISIVDNKGDIYKAKLEKVGNKNDKQ